ncbi:MAG: hypothetical protein WAK48_15500, partial [Candidatus Acidiferrum sp.]
PARDPKARPRFQKDGRADPGPFRDYPGREPVPVGPPADGPEMQIYKDRNTVKIEAASTWCG